jgi:hypothetical protein
LYILCNFSCGKYIRNKSMILVLQDNVKTKTWRPCWYYKQKKLNEKYFVNDLRHGGYDVTCNRRIEIFHDHEKTAMLDDRLIECLSPEEIGPLQLEVTWGSRFLTYCSFHPTDMAAVTWSCKALALYQRDHPIEVLLACGPAGPSSPNFRAIPWNDVSQVNELVPDRRIAKPLFGDLFDTVHMKSSIF